MEKIRAALDPVLKANPLFIRHDSNGVCWLAFETSQKSLKREWAIRCDIKSVNTDSLPLEFKMENWVDPDPHYLFENEDNAVGWALAHLNPCLRGNRERLQCAVECWRNNDADEQQKRRLRRVLRMNRMKVDSEWVKNILQETMHGKKTADTMRSGWAILERNKQLSTNKTRTEDQVLLFDGCCQKCIFISMQISFSYNVDM
jgi:hypothetical protein